MIDVLLLYEHKAREIEVITALKLLLQKKGINAEIRCVYDTDRNKYWTSKKPRLVVVPCLYSNVEIKEIVTANCGKINKVLNLQWEQVYNGDSDTAKRTPKDDAKFATHICWGKKAQTRLLNGDVKNAIVTGPPHMDFLKEKYSTYYYSKSDICEKYEIPKEKKLILFISSFSYCALSEKELDDNQTRADWDVRRFRDLSVTSRKTIMQWLSRFVEDNPDYCVIYRPHPAEKADTELEDFANQNKGIRIINEMSVKQWIVVADIVLNWFSTSGVEAFFAGKDCVYLRPEVFPSSYDYKMYRKAYMVKSYNQMEQIIHNPKMIEDYYVSNPIADDISEYYLNDGSYAIENISDLIVEMLNTNKYDAEYQCVNRRLLMTTYLNNLARDIVLRLYTRKPSMIESSLGKVPRIREALESYSKKKTDIASDEILDEIKGRLSFIGE